MRERECSKGAAFWSLRPWEISFCVKGKYPFLLLPKVFKLLFGIL